MENVQAKPLVVVPVQSAPTFLSVRNSTFAALLIGYMGFYLCRQNLSEAYAPMKASLGMSKETFGAIASLGTFVYAIGKLTTGGLSDALGGRKLFLLGLFSSRCGR